jgi:hypothetical protein
VFLLVERNVNGVMEPNRPIIYHFIPNVFYGDEGAMTRITSIIQGFLGLLILIYNGFILIKSRRLRRIFLELGTLDLIYSGLSIGNLVILHLQSRHNYDNQELLNMDEYVV